MLLFEDKYTGDDKQSFLDKVNSIAFKLGVNPNWIMYAMYNESGLNPASQAHWYKFSGCGGGYAGGLIGFTPCTMQQLGYYGGPDNFVKLTGTEQLDYVYDLFKPYAGRINNYADLYLITAFPAALGQSKDYIFQTSSLSPEQVVKGLPLFDLNGDKQITLQEFYDWNDNRARSIIPYEYLNQFIDTGSGQTVTWNVIQTHERDLLIIFLILGLATMIFFVTYKLLK